MWRTVEQGCIEIEGKNQIKVHVKTVLLCNLKKKLNQREN